MTAVLILTFIAVLVGLFYSGRSVVGADRERKLVYKVVDSGSRPSEYLEVSRHLVQQAFRTVKLLLLTLTVFLALIEYPEDRDLRSLILRFLLITVIFMISSAAIHENVMNKKIVKTILEERTRRDRS